VKQPDDGFDKMPDKGPILVEPIASLACAMTYSEETIEKIAALVEINDFFAGDLAAATALAGEILAAILADQVLDDQRVALLEARVVTLEAEIKEWRRARR
jgi:hypothetical protein